MPSLIEPSCARDEGKYIQEAMTEMLRLLVWWLKVGGAPASLKVFVSDQRAHIAGWDGGETRIMVFCEQCTAV